MKNKKDYVCPELTSMQVYCQDVLLGSAETDPFLNENSPWESEVH